MDLFKSILDNTLSHYYPTDLQEHDDEYYNSSQRKNLIELSYSLHRNEKLIKSIQNSLNKLTDKKFAYFAMGQNFPCYFFQCVERTDSSVKSINVGLSFLGPYYDLKILEYQGRKQPIKVFYKSNSELETIKSYIENHLHLIQIPNEILYENIQNIQPLNKFTYFNAFFVDAYRIMDL